MEQPGSSARGRERAVEPPNPIGQHAFAHLSRVATMFYDSVHRLRLWLWRRQERMLERTHRLRRAEDASTLPSASGTAGYAAGADAGFHAGMFAGYENTNTNTNTNINSATCLDSGPSCSSSSDSGSSGGGGD